jgi:hypothetical protein
MASGSDIRAGGAFVEVFVKGFAATQRQLTSIGANVSKLGAGIAAVGTAIVGPLAAATQSFISTGSAINDAAARAQIGKGQMAQLAYAANLAGASLEDVEKAIINQRKKGVSGTFDEVAARIAAMTDENERAKAANDAWGRSGAKLLPMLDTLQAVKAEARDLGIGVNEQDIANADELGDAVDRIKAQFGAIVFNVGAALAPMLIDAAGVVSGILKSVTRWVSENRAVFRTIALVGVALVAVGTVVASIGGGLAALGLAMSGLATLAALVLSPVGLILVAVLAIGVAIAAAVVWWVKFTAGGKAAFAALTAGMKPFIDTLKTAFDGITKAISAGNIQLAWKILVTALKLEWFRMVDAIIGRFLDMVKTIADNDLVRGLIGEGLSGKIDAMIAAGKSGSGAAVASLERELTTLRAMAVELDRKRAADDAKAGRPDAVEADGKTAESKLLTASTTASAVALTFGQHRPGDLTREMLDELRFIRRHSIRAHEELLREFRGFGPRAGS